jgi:hypothetical protein
VSKYTKNIALNNLALHSSTQKQFHGRPSLHFSRHVAEHLSATFPGKEIGRDSQILWPPREPDLTSLDSFF